MKRYWEDPKLTPTPEEVFLNRRAFIRKLALGSVGAYALVAGFGRAEAQDTASRPAATTTTASISPSSSAGPIIYPAAPEGVVFPYARNGKFTLDRAITKEAKAASYNNFYEFSEQKDAVWKLAQKLTTQPWTIEVAGLCEKPQTFDVAALMKSMPLEERTYRFRCVEAWAMAVPWTGFPLRALLDRVQPFSKAKYVRFISFYRPDEAINQERAKWYQWPYYEGLRMDEARNELAFVAVGIYGHMLPKQHGAPFRIVVPWKYGYKGPKSVVRIELVEEQPKTFWNDLAPSEYSFLSNVDPKVPHPRWSQAREHLIDTGEYRPTLPYNGYGEWVAGMYA